MKNLYTIIVMLTLLVSLLSCSDTEEIQCDPILDASDNICLSIEANVFNPGTKELIRDICVQSVSAIASRMPIDDLSIIINSNLSLVIPEIGLGGYNPDANTVIIAIDSRLNDIDEAISNEFFGLLAHEMHHAVRRRSVGYGTTLLEAMVTEGLADHFSVEVASVSTPIWSRALTQQQINDLTDMASQTWLQNGYNHNDWFFGNGVDIPRWAGYTIGFELVKDYLKNNPGTLPSQLHDEPADSFVP